MAIFTVRRELLVIAWLTIAAAIISPLVLAWSVIYTTGGLQFVVRHLPHRFAGVQLDIVGVSGTVARGLAVERVEIDHELVHLKFEGIEGRVALRPLLLQTIRVRHGSVASALIEVKRRTHPPTPGPPSFMPRWLTVSADQGRVGHATIVVANGARLEFTDVNGAAVIRHHIIRFFQAEGVLAGAVRLSAIGDLIAADPLRLEVQGRAQWSPAGLPAWTVSGSARGDLDFLNIVAHTVTPFRADFSGQGVDLTDRWHFIGDASVREFELRAFGIDSPLGDITGHLAGRWDAAGFSAYGPLTPSGLHAGVFQTQFAAAYADRVLTVKHGELRHPASGARASVSGTIAVDGPRLELTGEVSEFRWPLLGAAPAVAGGAGSFELSGTLPLRVHVKGSTRTSTLPAIPLEVSGTLDKDSFAFDSAELDLLGGHASVSGQVQWSPQPQWAVAGHLTGINPATLRPDLPGSVGFALAASGSGFDASKDFTASISNLAGKLRGVAAGGSGTVTRAGDTLAFSAVRVTLGNAHLALDGHVDDRADLRFAVTTTDLSLVAPDMRGQLRASGTVRGTFAEPAIVATAHGGDFEYQGLTLAGFDADINFQPGAFQQQSKVDVRLRQLSYQGRTLDSVALTLAGLPSAYDVHLALSATGLSAHAQARGAFAHDVFLGELEALAIDGSESLHLALERPVDLLAGPDHSRLDWLCLTGTPGSLCADGDWTPGGWSTTVRTNQLPLKTLTAGKTPAVEYLGTVSALARLSAGAGKPVVGTLRAELEEAEIAHKLASHKTEHTRIGSGTVEVNATPALVSAQVDLGEGEVGTLHGNLEAQRSVAGEAVPLPDMPLSGELHAQTAELGLLSLYMPDIDRAAGHFNADIQVAGTTGAPRLTGLVKIRDGEIDVYQVNLALRELSVDARLDDTSIGFEGSARAGRGSVTADGRLEWRALQPYGKLHLKGTELRVADVPEAQIDASPDLDFTIAGRRIEVTGKVAVPYAKIQPKDFTGAVRASSDEVIVGTPEENPAERLEVMSTVTLSLGDRVTIDTAGLTGRLTGAITIRNGYDAITRANGELSVADGKWSAYGRKLDIERGRLIFASGPIGDPGIEVRAIKEFPDVKAGVNVRGTLRAPRMTFFSDPPLPQSQIVSLILAGGSLESAQNRIGSAGGNFGGTGSSAGNAALAQGAAILGQELGSHVGIEDVSLESDVTNETSLVLGRYLSPRLYVSYGISLTQQLNTLKMRYTLGDHWTFKTEAGQAYGADLVYSIDK